jgi:hypothetical protein
MITFSQKVSGREKQNEQLPQGDIFGPDGGIGSWIGNARRHGGQ